MAGPPASPGIECVTCHRGFPAFHPVTRARIEFSGGVMVPLLTLSRDVPSRRRSVRAFFAHLQPPRLLRASANALNTIAKIAHVRQFSEGLSLDMIAKLVKMLAAGGRPASIPTFLPEALKQPGERRRAPVNAWNRPARRYVPVRVKFVVSLVTGVAWLGLSAWLARPWIDDLSILIGAPLAWFAIGGIALAPGFMNAFLAASLLLDRRPTRQKLDYYPGISVLVSAYNESRSITDTLQSIALTHYPGALDVIVIDDGSVDGTADIAEALSHPWLRVLRQPQNLGKSAALNRGLASARHQLVVTLDADSYLYGDSLQRLVERYLSDPPATRAVAGTMLVRNSRTNWVTRAQEWDYFHGIAAVKRIQSLYQGTLVAQGAFSIYDRTTLQELGGWDECVGEDIVLTWAFLQAGWRVGHAEDACCFTNAPETLPQFIRQRQRWARGMMEAFRQHRRILAVWRMSTLFIWWNLLFPWLDTAYTLFFIPGVVLAVFGIYWIAGPMTLALLPMGLVMNYLMFRIGRNMFTTQGLRVRQNLSGFLIYAFAYSAILQPACVWGYLSEILGLRKTWGTK